MWKFPTKPWFLLFLRGVFSTRGMGLFCSLPLLVLVRIPSTHSDLTPPISHLFCERKAANTFPTKSTSHRSKFSAIHIPRKSTSIYRYNQPQDPADSSPTSLFSVTITSSRNPIKVTQKSFKIPQNPTQNPIQLPFESHRILCSQRPSANPCA